LYVGVHGCVEGQVGRHVRQVDGLDHVALLSVA
jgi:hypothetical protein